MPRPRKCRKVCCLPECREFVPADKKTDKPPVILKVDEYESIRLIDKIGLSQEECAAYMQVARTTAQQVYNTARTKIAIALCEGVGLKIEGGDYKLCSDDEDFCGCMGCRRNIQPKKREENQKEDKDMKIIMPVDDENNVCVSFARAPKFAIKNSQSEEVVYIDNPASEAESGAGLKAAQVVVDSGADVLLTVRLGENAAEVLKVAGIEIYKTKGNNVEDNFRLHKNGELEKLTKFHAGYHGIQ